MLFHVLILKFSWIHLYQSAPFWLCLSGPYFLPTQNMDSPSMPTIKTKLIASSKDNATVGIDKPTPPLEVWGTVGDTEVTLEWNLFKVLVGIKFIN